MKNWTDTEIAEAFRPHELAAAEWYEGHIRGLWKKFAGGADLLEGDALRDAMRLSNAFGRAGAEWRTLFRYVCAAHPDYRRNGPKMLDADRLARDAMEFGRDQVAAFVTKLIGKIGDLEDAKLRHLGGTGEFRITGTLGGRTVVVDQQRVFKTSSRGRLFCQWPARIYVDGQFTPAKDFAAMAADA